MSFPDRLDGAKVLFYTEENDFGVVRYTTGEIAAHIKYLAICRYDNDGTYYLFKCNEQIEVEADQDHASLDECMHSAVKSYGKEISWIEKSGDR